MAKNWVISVLIDEEATGMDKERAEEFLDQFIEIARVWIDDGMITGGVSMEVVDG